MDKSLYNQPLFKKAAGLTLRPGGLEITVKGLEVCAWPENALVADIGCGVGAGLKVMKSRGLNPIGLDSCPDSVLEAHGNSGCPTVLGRAEELPWPDEYLDGLICECVLSLTDDQPLVLKEFYRVLKAGGKLVVSDISVVSLTTDSSFQSNTCLQGAIHPDITLHRLSDAGFTVTVINEYPEALKQLAAQLLWQGSTDLKKWLGPFCASDKCGVTYSYLQWIGGKSS